tara:strand:+ start:3964 stop:5658 length:1695 start_codon:yes stop_codon:yes gene_type:complete
MNETKRTIFTGLVIGLLTLAIPFYLQLIGVVPSGKTETTVNQPPEKIAKTPPVEPVSKQKKETDLKSQKFSQKKDFTIVTNQYKAIVTNLSGGSILSFEMHSFNEDGYKYVGGYDENGNYSKNINLNLSIPVQSPCSPCLEVYSKRYFDVPFKIVSPNIRPGQTLRLENNDSLVVVMEKTINDETVIKKTTFYADKYIIDHDYSLTNTPQPVSVVWADGINSTEKNLFEEITYSSGYVAQSKEINSISFTPKNANDKEDRVSFSGKTDWVAIRNKYFINALISKNSFGGSLSGSSHQLNNESVIPVYKMELEFPSSEVSVSQFFGPLDVDVIESSNTYLDRVMNFGWLPIQPFSRSVLWLLKKLHVLGINYGVILILFAFMIRIITGPLTRKSFESTQKMQKIQPRLKKIQEKYKNDSQRLNKEMVALYKETGVNPLGGCLPMLIQMPLLFSLFIVFRSTIEFRGAPFFGWISNLSQPDTIFDLSFSIPLYGNQVAFLPFLLGISMFLTQRLSMATMDKNTKPMMYMMTGFFFILFNSFPSGLNLYYTVYNFLNYFQQRSIKGK